MLIGTANNNPILSTSMYKVKFVDKHKQAMTTNLIAQKMFAQVDMDSYPHLLMDNIIDTRKDATTVVKGGEFITSQNSTKRRKEATKGWKVLVQWKDRSTTWSKLKNVIDSYLVELAKYAIQNRILDKTTFTWWVDYTIKKKAQII